MLPNASTFQNRLVSKWTDVTSQTNTGMNDLDFHLRWKKVLQWPSSCESFQSITKKLDMALVWASLKNLVTISIHKIVVQFTQTYSGDIVRKTMYLPLLQHSWYPFLQTWYDNGFHNTACTSFNDFNLHVWSQPHEESKRLDYWEQIRAKTSINKMDHLSICSSSQGEGNIKWAASTFVNNVN